MLNYTDFKNRIVEDLKKRARSYGRKLDFEFVRIPSPVGNNERLNVCPSGSYTALSFRIEDIYSDYLDGKNIDDILEKMNEVIEHNLSAGRCSSDTHQRVKEQILNYSVIKEHFNLRMVPGDSPFLKNAPHKMIVDMAVVIEADVSALSDSDQRATVVITNDLMELYGVSKDELFKQAEKMSMKNSPLELISMADKFRRMGAPWEVIEEVEKNGPTIYIASNNNGFYGASVLAYPDFLESAASKVDGDFYLIPSSVHELLIFYDDGRMDDPEALNSAIHDVNADCLDKKDFLSDHGYHYEALTKTFESVDDYHKRKFFAWMDNYIPPLR